MKQLILFVIIILVGVPILSQSLPLLFHTKDTTRYYVVEIKERTKCDTLTVLGTCSRVGMGEAQVCAAMHYKTVIVCDDTTWAPKIQIWLTPVQIDKLMEILK